MAKRKTPAKAAPKKAVKKSASPGKRMSWLDDKSQPLIDDYARQTESFLKAMADGTIEPREIKEQEKKVVALMKKIEPLVDDSLHAKLTQLLCELTVYDIMQVLGSIHQLRPAANFHG